MYPTNLFSSHDYSNFINLFENTESPNGLSTPDDLSMGIPETVIEKGHSITQSSLDKDSDCWSSTVRRDQTATSLCEITHSSIQETDSLTDQNDRTSDEQQEQPIGLLQAGPTDYIAPLPLVPPPSIVAPSYRLNPEASQVPAVHSLAPRNFGKMLASEELSSSVSSTEQPYTTDFTRISSSVTIGKLKPVRNKSATRCLAIAWLIRGVSLTIKPNWISDFDWCQHYQDKPPVESIRSVEGCLSFLIDEKFDALLHKNVTSSESITSKKARFRWWSDNRKVVPKIRAGSLSLKENILGRNIVLPPFLTNHPHLQKLAIQNFTLYLQEIQNFFESIAIRSLQLRVEVNLNHKFIVLEVEKEFSKKWADEM